MAFQAVPDTAQITVEYTQNNEICLNTFYGLKPGGYNLTELGQLANSIDNGVGASWLPIQTQDTTYNRTIVRGLALENDLEVVDSGNFGPGLALFRGSPNNVTYSIKKSSGLTGRSARGRCYWIGLSNADLDINENRVTGGAAVAIIAAVEAIRVATAVLGWQPVLVSRFSGGVQRLIGVTFPWVSTDAVNDNIDSQRRRLTR